MSNRKSASQMRREWWILCIRERPEGRQVNRSHCMRIDKDLEELIKVGVVRKFRGKGGASVFCNVQRTLVTMADGSVNPPGPLACPCCNRMGNDTRNISHKSWCTIPRSRSSESVKPKRRKLLDAYNKD